MRIFAAVVLGVTLAASVAWGQDFEAAGKHFAAAKRAFELHLYSSAALEFQRAYNIAKDPVLLYNVGESSQRAGDGRGAVEAYRAYLKAVPNAADRHEVERRIRHILAAHYKIPDQSSTEDSAPLPSRQPAEAPALAKPTTPGPPPPTPVAPATPPPAAVAPPPAELPSVLAPTHVETPRSHSRGPWISAWVTFGVAVAALGAGAGLSVVAHQRSQSIGDLQHVDTSGQPSVYDAATQQRYKQLQDENRHFAGAAIGCFTVGAAAAVASTVLFIVDSRRHRTETATLRPSVGLGRGGALLGGSF
jgi:hypothetical protein